MELNDLGFYCNDCGKVFKSYELEKTKIEVSIGYNYFFECPECSGTAFQIYSPKGY